MTFEERYKLRKRLKACYRLLTCSVLCTSLIVGKSTSTEVEKNDSPYYVNPIENDDLVNLKKPKIAIETKEIIIEPTNEEKMLWIANNYDISLEELKDIIGGMIAESYQRGYDEAYRVTSVLYNRTCSIKFTYDFGTNIYNQFTADNQFEVYPTGAYQLYRESIELEEYQAVIDMLYSCLPSIDALSFRSASSNLSISYIQYQDNGNKFFNEITEEDKLQEPLILSRKEN